MTRLKYPKSEMMEFFTISNGQNFNLRGILLAEITILVKFGDPKFIFAYNSDFKNKLEIDSIQNPQDS